MCGQEVARKILDDNKLEKIHVVSTSGTLSDHYDSSHNVIRLSDDIFNNNTVASVAIAAHECGHAIQDKVGYSFYRLRKMIYQTAWKENGNVSGLVEISMVISEDMPHYVR